MGFFYFIRNTGKIFLFFSLVVGVILSNCTFLSVIHVHAQSNSYYDQELELEYGIPTQLSSVKVPADNIFESHAISGFFLSVNFSNNSGIIWINDINNETIWSDHLNESFEIYIKINNTSIRQYRLWANSSTLGNNTLHYTFSPNIIHAGNWAIIIAIFFIPAIIVVVIVTALVRKKKPHSVRIAERITKRMALKYQNKYQGIGGKYINKKQRNLMPKLCPKCGYEIKNQDDKFCSECGFMVKQ
ncbi:MAG: zinc ribbon domain-containing protein [Candidatus Thorarchaeota archaeon]